MLDQVGQINHNNINNDNNNNINMIEGNQNGLNANNIEYEQILQQDLDFSASNISGFVLDRLQKTLLNINQTAVFFKCICLAEITASIGLTVYLLLTQEMLGLLLAIGIIQIIFTLFNIFCFNIQMTKQPSKSVIARIGRFFLYFAFCLLQLEYIPFYRYSSNLSKEIRSFNQQSQTLSALKQKQKQLIVWFGMKRYYLFAKCCTYLLFIVINQLINYHINYDLVIAYFGFTTLFYLCITHFYLKQFVFQQKLSMTSHTVTFIESALQYAQSCCILIIIIYHTQLRITIICLLIFYLTLLKCQLQHQGAFQPLSVDLFQMLFMGQKLTYLAPLYNGDIHQSEIMFRSFFNIIQFITYEIYYISSTAIVLLRQTEYFPQYLVILQLSLLIANIVILCLKLVPIKRRFSQSKSYSFQKLQSIKIQSLTNFICKLNLRFQQRVEDKDWNIIRDLLNLDCKEFYLRFSEQFAVHKILNYSILEIQSFESSCLLNIYDYLLKNSISLQIKINHKYSDMNQSKSKLAKSLLFNILKHNQISDQRKIDLENSEILKYFQKEKYFPNIQQVLRNYNSEVIMINLVSYYKHISQFQYINSTMVLFDLYDNEL